MTENFDKATAWNHFYLWGISSKPVAEVEFRPEQLKALLGMVGVDAAVVSLAAFEPRYLINQKGTTAWMLLFIFALMNDREGLEAVANGKAAIYMPAKRLQQDFNSHVAWPAPLLEKFPFSFGESSPFVIPFVRFGGAGAPRPMPQSLKSPDGAIEIMGVEEFDERRPDALLALFHQFHAKYGKNYA